MIGVMIVGVVVSEKTWEKARDGQFGTLSFNVLSHDSYADSRKVYDEEIVLNVHHFCRADDPVIAMIHSGVKVSFIGHLRKYKKRIYVKAAGSIFVSPDVADVAPGVHHLEPMTGEEPDGDDIE